MRPPRNAGESPLLVLPRPVKRIGFNEAPAKRGGKSFIAASLMALISGFNEAPAKRGGKSCLPWAPHRDMGRFNEAPAKRGGKCRAARHVARGSQQLQ